MTPANFIQLIKNDNERFDQEQKFQIRKLKASKESKYKSLGKKTMNDKIDHGNAKNDASGGGVLDRC